MKKFLLIPIIGLLSLIGCTKYQSDLNTDSCKDTIIINSPKYSSTVTDDFEISKAYIKGDCLKINVAVGGGCGTIDFTLLAREEVIETLPVQREIRLVVDDNDTCEMLINKELSYDISGLKIAPHGSINILLEGYEKPITYTY
tara:strand:- start:108826 stop:109254 length:429 start_codon:yes stop_codon:yes gene_type:complete